MIHNIGGQSILNSQPQNPSLQNIISQINANVSKKQNFDAVELSQKAQALLKESNSASSKESEPIINHENSEMVHSTKWGAHTKAEYAEMSLISQRDDLKTLSDQIDYHKSKLAFTTEKISELESFLSGTSAHSDPNLTKEAAEIHLHNYKQSIADDYADFTIGRSQYIADQLDSLSGQLASKASPNPLHSLDAAALGLSNLPDDPEKIMEALDSASAILDRMTADLERAFSDATGGKEFQEPAKSHSIFDGNSTLSFFASQMEKEHKLLNVGTANFTGETLKIDISSVSGLAAADIAP